MTVLEVAALKKIGKGSTLLLLDRNGSASKAVAKELTALGFRKALVVSGGYSGARRTGGMRVPRVLGPHARLGWLCCRWVCR